MRLQSARDEWHRISRCIPVLSMPIVCPFGACSQRKTCRGSSAMIQHALDGDTGLYKKVVKLPSLFIHLSEILVSRSPSPHPALLCDGPLPCSREEGRVGLGSFLSLSLSNARQHARFLHLRDIRSSVDPPCSRPSSGQRERSDFGQSLVLRSMAVLREAPSRRLPVSQSLITGRPYSDCFASLQKQRHLRVLLYRRARLDWCELGSVLGARYRLTEIFAQAKNLATAASESRCTLGRPREVAKPGFSEFYPPLLSSPSC